MNNLILIGMMGCGKSTVGRLAAEKLGLAFVDTDERIERASGRTIPEIFASEGEEGFRGPMGMVFCRCRGVTLRGYTYRNAANWCHQLDSCIQVRMDHVTVLGGHDGVNLHHCTQVWIDNCDFRTGDDCIAGYDAENVVVRNCSLNTL